MLNQLIISGRMIDNPKFRKSEDGEIVADITLAVPRPYKNESGEYEIDFIPCILWKSIAESTIECCQQGDLVAVKGRLQTSKDIDNKLEINIVAEKVSFLSSKSIDKEDRDDR